MPLKNKVGGSSHGSGETNLSGIHEDVGSIPSLLSGLRIHHCCEPWCMLPMRLGSGIAVAVV